MRLLVKAFAQGSAKAGVAMRFWWVNQKRTYQEERDKGLLWAPLRDTAGHKVEHWERMDEPRPGDLVIHYKSGIRAWSIVREGARAARQPYEIVDATWAQEGRQVLVEVTEIDLALALGTLPLSLRKHQNPPAGWPFRKDGTVKLGYLFEIDEVGAREILSAAGIDLSADKTGLYTADDGHLPIAQIGFRRDRLVLELARGEQAELRKRLFGSRSTAACDICGRNLPVRMLVAAHIKKRSLATVVQRLDANIVMAACSLGCDALFEMGYLVVDHRGFVSRGQAEAVTADAELLVSERVGGACSAFNEESRKYFAWHRRHHSLA